MSVDATRWAWERQGLTPSQKLILLALADRADESCACYPSEARLRRDTGMDRKTVMAAVAGLERAGLLAVEREVGRVNTYRLVGVPLRENQSQKRDQSQNRDQSQKRDMTSPKNGTTTSPKNGTQNRSVEPINNHHVHLHMVSPSERPRQRAGEPGFEVFWTAYPRRVGKRPAAALWEKLGAADRAAALADLGRRQWPAEAQYIPHPRTYLSQRRWEDEPAAAAACGFGEDL